MDNTDSKQTRVRPVDPLYRKGVSISCPFNLNSSMPLDNRTLAHYLVELEDMPRIKLYPGLCAYVTSNMIEYVYAFDENGNLRWMPNKFDFLYGETDPLPEDGFEGQIYINTQSGIMFKKVRNFELDNEEWVDIISIKGGVGPTGPKGDQGIRGSIWHFGTAIDGSSENGIYPDSNVDSAIVGDMYMNTTTCNVYRCASAGGSTQAVWQYAANIKGDKGVDPAQEIYTNAKVPSVTNVKEALDWIIDNLVPTT